MTQEEKQLLLKDLCARLPYGVKASIVKRIQDDSAIKDCTVLSMMWMVSLEKRLEDVKPYLRPMSSMTEEEKKELFDLCYFYVEEDWEGKKTEVYGIEIASRPGPNYCYDYDFKFWGVNMKSIDWLNAHHFDYRGLITMGLAIEAPEGMYNENC